MIKEDRIIQITNPNERYTIHGLSEYGRLFALVVNDKGEREWKLICEPPEVELEDLPPFPDPELASIPN